MDLHKKFQTLPIIDLSIILGSKNYQSMINNLIKVFNNELLTSTIDINNLKTYHMILCQNYQQNPKEKFLENNLSIADLFSQSNNFANNQFLLIKDIIILRLFFDPTNIYHEFDQFRCKNSLTVNIIQNEEQNFYMNFIECFVDVFRLLHFNNVQFECSNFNFPIASDLEIWYRHKNEKSCGILVSLVPKFIEISLIECLETLWLLIRDNNDLTGFCIVLNFLSREKKIFYQILQDGELWTIILNGLKDSKESTRKQAMFVFKIIAEFLCKEDEYFGKTSQLPKLIQSDGSVSRTKQIPFTCNSNRESISEVRKNFILILESLEEKKQHLVIPTFSILSNLLVAYQDHQQCSDCFEFRWLGCIFEKILRHESNTIVKLGVSFILQLNPNDYDDNFISLLANALNNRFLYEIEDDDYDGPKIFYELCRFLEKFENGFIDKFLSSISKVSWDPISIFYVTLSLARGEISCQCSRENLMSLKKLVEGNLCHHSLLLRKGSQRNIIIAITRWKWEEIDLKALASFLVSFPKDECLQLNSECWRMIVDLLGKFSISGTEYIRECCENIGENREINIESFARMLAILEDSHHLSEENAFGDLVQLFYSIHNVNSRLYLNHELAQSILELFFSLVDYENFSKFLLPFSTDVLDFLTIAGKSPNLRIDKYLPYFQKIPLLLRKENLIGKLDQEALYCLNANCPPLRRLFGIKMLEICQKQRNGFLTKEIFDIFLKNFSIPLMFEEEKSFVEIKGRATMEYYLTFTKILHLYLATTCSDIPNSLTIASELFDKSGVCGVPFVTGIVAEIVGQKIFVDSKDFGSVKNLMDICWKSIFLGKKNRYFWMTLDNIFRVLLCPNFFQVETTFVLELLTSILNQGDTAPRIKIYLLEQLSNLETKCLFLFQEAILNCILHGQALRKDAKIELQALEFLSNGNVDTTKISNYNIDSEIRARGIILLHRAVCENEEFAIVIFHHALKIFKKYKDKRYFADSNSHRIQQRICQILLILEPILNEECRILLKNELIDILLSNTADQPSIQIMMSWILSKIFSYQKSDPSELVNFFKQIKEKRPGNLKFAAGVILQISKLLKEDDDNFNNFFTTAISLLAPECLGPTFNTRLVCQIVIVKLYKRLNYSDNLYKATIETLNQRNFSIVNEFYYEDFHLLNNYNLQSIYYDVPRLANMSSDELISPTEFENYGFIQLEKHSLTLFDNSNSLTRLQLIRNKVKSQGSQEKNEELKNDCLVDLQKKIVPDKLAIFNNTDSEEMTKNESIIVVASLVERIPNLGGIARTCEIFGAGELVIANKMFIENKEFQSLSVTAEKWIKITEVKPQELSKYLLEMKENGWKLIGLEQTINSCTLLEKKFERKTVLLLGNEKDGIPPNLIPILDNCVEIPQVGIIRSLNVHVTGAICIWEYAKQHCFN
ncbi:uncharacterized protein LOC122499663 isoform X2 [Leptopilina heterotoma]|uniref:uncharacterized protein LOC122499663 isoform X2 n=1 Tax=Leptopilina heterotoma TaxID=63436 RepID=UPI001CA8E99B|nr:uncharacterized protein LOC122499663 isoform X2 [Leptopilina heterotoma]